MQGLRSKYPLKSLILLALYNVTCFQDCGFKSLGPNITKQHLLSSYVILPLPYYSLFISDGSWKCIQSFSVFVAIAPMGKIQIIRWLLFHSLFESPLDEDVLLLGQQLHWFSLMLQKEIPYIWGYHYPCSLFKALPSSMVIKGCNILLVGFL